MIVKNEQSSLARCLHSVGGLCREIVIVDTGSTDATCEIALAHGASVWDYDFALIDFAAARNYALDRATGRWVLVLDADEVLHAGSAPLVRDLVDRDLNAGYYVERINRHANPAQTMTDYPLRLFPNRPDYRYRGKVHETVDASILAGGGRLVRSEIQARARLRCRSRGAAQQKSRLYRHSQQRNRSGSRRLLSAGFSRRRVSPTRDVQPGGRDRAAHCKSSAFRRPGPFACRSLRSRLSGLPRTRSRELRNGPASSPRLSRSPGVSKRDPAHLTHSFELVGPAVHENLIKTDGTLYY